MYYRDSDCPLLELYSLVLGFVVSWGTTFVFICLIRSDEMRQGCQCASDYHESTIIAPFQGASFDGMMNFEHLSHHITFQRKRLTLLQKK